MARYAQARQLAELDPSAEPGNYIILNAQSINATSHNELKLTFLKGNRLGVTRGRDHEEEEYWKTFKIQPCSDNYGANFVLSLYKSPTHQWVLNTNGTGVGVEIYPNLGAAGDRDPERLRPPQNWRFAFEQNGPGSKLYRIMCMDEGLAQGGENYLSLGPSNQSGEFQVGFDRRRDNDQNQLWCLQEV